MCHCTKYVEKNNCLFPPSDFVASFAWFLVSSGVECNHIWSLGRYEGVVTCKIK